MALRDLGELVDEILRGPNSYPVLCLWCGECGQLSPRMIVRRQGSSTAGTTPPEYLCELCGAYTPRVHGDQVAARIECPACRHEVPGPAT